MLIDQACEIFKNEIVPERGQEPRYSIILFATGPADISAALQDDEGCYIVESGSYSHASGALLSLAVMIKARNAEIERRRPKLGDKLCASARKGE